AEALLERLLPGDEVALELDAARVVQAGRERPGRAVVIGEEVPGLLAGGIAVDAGALLELELEVRAEELVQPLVLAPREWRGRRRLRRSWHELLQHAEHLEDVAVAFPGREHHATAGSDDARHLGSRRLRLADEHHSEGRDDAVEGAIREGKALGVGMPVVDVELVFR